ncbi:MAG: class I SAM-dependent methyltransferase [Candidatus Taylorbacteria bacterium]|nr:class I SAM-dependent methyltransferase [Candidatus Taylorbacteria bacterium]
MREKNSFEDNKIAQQWITAIEKPQDSSREREYYPLLYSWSHDMHDATIVEIGSGQGICSSKIDLVNNRYIGVEPSQALLDRAKALYPEPSKQFLLGNSYESSLSDASIDAVFSVGVWFHVENIDRAHAEMRRILKPGGKLLILTGNHAAQSQWESFFENPVVTGNIIEGKVYVPGGSMDHNILYLHDSEDLRTSLVKNGFVVDSIREMGFGGKQKRPLGIFICVQATKLG